VKNKLYLKIKRILLNKKIVAFLVCLLIATFLWLINALNRNYTKTIAIPVKFINLPKNKSLSSELPREIQADIKASGAKLFFIDFKKNEHEVVIDLNNFIKGQNQSKTLAINTALSIGNLSRLFNTEIELIKVKPDSIYFSFGKAYKKVVPVIPDLQIDFDTLYNYGDKVKIYPSSVTLFGDSILLNTIDDIKTEKIILNNLNKTINQKASLFLPEELEERIGISNDEVNLTINVDKFTQLNLEVPIDVIGLPSQYQLKTFPNKTTVQIKIGLLEYDSLQSGQFKLVVDYKDIQKNKHKLPIKIEQQPDNVNIIKIIPDKVEYLIKKH
jgi:YbbR domain-containing protein